MEGHSFIHISQLAEWKRSTADVVPAFSMQSDAVLWAVKDLSAKASEGNHAVVEHMFKDTEQ